MADVTVQNFIDDFMTAANEAAARTALGLGTAAVANLNNMAVTGGTIDGTTIGGTTAAAGTFTALAAASLSVAQGTLTNPATGLNLTATWNDAADTFRGVDVAISNTNSASGSTALRVRTGTSGTTEILSLTEIGILTVSPRVGVHALTVGGARVGLGTFAMLVGTEGVVGFTNSSSYAGTVDTSLSYGGSAGIIRQAPSFGTGSQAQEFQIFGTRADASNYERLVLRTAAGDCTIATEAAGTGTLRNLKFNGANRAAYNASPTTTDIRDILIAWGLMAAS